MSTQYTPESLPLAIPAGNYRNARAWNASLVAGAAVFGVFVLVALCASWFAPFDPLDQNLMNRMLPPAFMNGGNWTHPLGTDALGRDTLSRLIFGARASLIVSVVAVLISGTIGSGLGIAAGYFGGRIDSAIMFIVTTRLAMPVALVALAVVALYGPSLRNLTIVLGLLVWDRFAVVLRNSTALIRSMDYVIAIRAVGASDLHILVRELLPNLLPLLIVVATFEMASLVLLESAFSFLGLGVQPPMPSWGLMIAEGREHLLFKPWIVAIPGFAIAIFVWSINLLGDGLRVVVAPETAL
jgi:peptide/nickel transport system permease protein